MTVTIDSSSTKNRQMLAALYDLWDQRRGSRRAPARDQFVAEEFKPWMAHLIIADVVGPERRIRLRLVGTEITQYDRRDYTGQFLDEILLPGVREVVLGQYRRCIDGVEPRAYHYQVTDGSTRSALVDKLFLPLSDNGITTSKVLLCIYAHLPSSSDALWRELQDLEVDGRTLDYEPRDLPRPVLPGSPLRSDRTRRQEFA